MIVFAGPGVAGAIRNQFNLVGNTVNNGTTGGVGGGGASGGSASATVQAAIAKDAKDWTLDEQEAVAEDIARTTNGHLDLLVITHEHWDHISGFSQAREIFTSSARASATSSAGRDRLVGLRARARFMRT